MHTYATPPQSGFTLIELLLYVGIIGSLLVGLSLFFATSADVRIKNQSISEVNQQGMLALEGISQTTRNAITIISPAATGTSNQLTLTMPTGSLSPTVFDISGTTLEIKEGANAPVALTSRKVQVTNLTINNLTRSGTRGVAQVSFTVTRTNPTGRNEYDYQKTFVTTAALRP